MVKLPDPEKDIGATLLRRLADRIDGLLRDKHWKHTSFARGKVSENTVRRVRHGKNARLSTLIALAEALDCDLVIEIKPRKEVECPQHVAPK